MINKIPIIYYHSIGNTALSVKPDNFKIQMQYLVDNCFTTILLKDLISGNYDPKNKNIVITFDDCFLDVYENALPILIESKFVATFFATLGYDNITLWGSEIKQRWNTRQHEDFIIPYKFMNRIHRKQLINCGMEIGSHTMTHSNLDELTYIELMYEVSESKRILEEELLRSVDSFCYPRGRYDDNVIDTVKKYYKNACITKSGYYLGGMNQYEIKRFGIGNNNNYFYAVVNNKLNIFNLRRYIRIILKKIFSIAQ